MKKRSVVIAGHRTSVSLEDPFWAELKAMAETREMPLAALIEEIDARRETDNLSSALRIAVLEDLRQRLEENG
ncbi:putative DNA-binding ribbon-helix-helix protein [Rhodopseudomonas julia]|uniref:DNA-binding ribbon-helix-helix protein n=1 Tax=Rhodopseudomonas julia TaxID=200617 RepID=A0ABU0C839_9BRAD|nr:ribbon-helix-helix domain-containing protein [Rhodopseudomonas julia]MDQ0326684.1 putative DNA-binding ribbon-helix-helix protein [Rhodopseudomonas julia]